MNRLGFILLISLLAWGVFGCWGCGKERNQTIVEGKVTDAETGAGLGDATIQFSVKDLGDDENITSILQSVITDDSGNFHIEIPFGKAGLGFTVYKDGYLYRVIKPDPAKQGETNSISILLFPADSWLRLTVRNESSEAATLFIGVTNPTVFPGGFEPTVIPFPLMLEPGLESTHVFDYSANTHAKIRWALSQIGYDQNPTIDSIYLFPSDTSEYLTSM